ncbi:uncharacterized protein LOC125074147 [Vanessa atalanta]|uniref:uncharacterized protein LOC125074147 n=1 Tax=Vanessa atalanta TaxID=42275 RepID=UPI001FCD7CE6|nr:uncharacterized protein LOC125074147 [Vanessa atalanta]
MDLKEIIKWFIPCFHVLLYYRIYKINFRLIICLFLLLPCPSFAGKVYRSDVVFNSYNVNNNTKNIGLFNEYQDQDHDRINAPRTYKSYEDTSVGRTFGRPFKKMIQALIPLAFQLGAAATWATVAALVGVKTLAVTLIILKLLLVAGAAKIGALFASKGHDHHQAWTPQQKEIHLHIHNGGLHGDEHSVPISPWSREGQSQADTKQVNVIYEPYPGPQTISTPYGHYMKIEPGAQVTQ